ncbi:MAG: hypothetical protein ACOCRK_11765 [bacterium]
MRLKQYVEYFTNLEFERYCNICIRNYELEKNIPEAWGCFLNVKFFNQLSE